MLKDRVQEKVFGVELGIGWEGRSVANEEISAMDEYTIIGSKDLKHWVAGVVGTFPNYCRNCLDCQRCHGQDCDLPKWQCHYGPRFRQGSNELERPCAPVFTKKFTLTIPNPAIRQALRESGLIRNRSFIIGIEPPDYYNHRDGTDDGE